MTITSSTPRLTVDGHLTAAKDALDRGHLRTALEHILAAKRDIEVELQFQAARRGKA